MIDWIGVHWKELIAVYGGLVTVASIIVKLTPNLRDDAVLLKITKFVSRFIALNRTVKDDEIRKVKK